MELIILGTTLFTVFLGLSNAVFINYFQWSYRDKFWFYVPFYTVPIMVVLWLIPELKSYLNSMIGISLLSFVILLFILFEGIWKRQVRSEECYGYNNILPAFKSMLDLSVRSAISKVCEIMLQQISALLIIIGLLAIGITPIIIALIFAVVVFILHIPSPRWHGKVFGGYFILMSTLLSPLFVYLIIKIDVGFYIAASLHFIMYIIIYSFSYYMRSPSIASRSLTA